MKRSDIEGERFQKFMAEFGRNRLPFGLPEEVHDLMAPAVMYPDDMVAIIKELSQSMPCTLELLVCSRTADCCVKT
jgi:hypothetical protein